MESKSHQPLYTRFGSRKVYTAALVIFLVLFIALAASLYVPQRTARADSRTWQRASSIANSINNSFGNLNHVPASLAVAGYKDSLPPDISYKKLSETKYQFCVTYRASGISRVDDGPAFNPWTAVSGDISNQSQDLYPGSSLYDGASSPNDYLVIPAKHTAGNNCQTITPTLKAEPAQPAKSALSQAADGHTLVCGVEVNYYVARGPILKITTQSAQFDNSGVQRPVTYITVNASQIPGDAGGMVNMVSPSSKIFDQQCNLLDTSTLKVGDTVQVYDITSPTVAAVSIFLKE